MRILRRAATVAVILALIGYILAEAYLMLIPMMGGVPNPANNAVRWRAPLTMAAIGVGLVALVELVTFAVRGNQVPDQPRTNRSAPDSPTAEKLPPSEPVDP
jgi:hypothetical protein